MLSFTPKDAYEQLTHLELEDYSVADLMRALNGIESFDDSQRWLALGIIVHRLGRGNHDLREAILLLNRGALSYALQK